jgi:hypothetical protein
MDVTVPQGVAPCGRAVWEWADMAGRYETDMGGSQERFLTTQWSLIEHVQAGADRDNVLIGSLLQKYWKPVYCYLRRRAATMSRPRT